MLELLRGVSRSFYLSIRLLPAPLRAPVGVGYLLARASDTLADAPGLPARERIEMLEQFNGALAGAPVPAVDGAIAATPDERKLLDALPRCFEALAQLPPQDQADVRTVLGHITQGQRLDVERFGDADAATPRALASTQELDRYTYLVAGSVGEFWTRLAFRHVDGVASLAHDEMLPLAREYGQALQLINILRDAQHDRAIGRIYLPAGESQDAALARAHAGLEAGMRYVAALRPARIRIATALPALVGARTLSLLRTKGAGAKMARSELRGMLLRIALARGSHASLQREFRRWDNRPA